MTTSTYVLTTNELARTRHKVEAAMKRAKKKGFPADLHVEATRRVVTNTGDYPDMPLGAHVVVWDTRITGEAPHYDGWRLLAAVDAIPASDGSTGWMIRSAIDSETGIDRDALVPGFCAHCQTNRANRRKLFVIENVETGKRLQVGKSCLADFLGLNITPTLLTASDVIERDAPDSVVPMFDQGYIVALAMAAVTLYGWRPSRDTGATVDHVRDYLAGKDTSLGEVMPTSDEVARLIEIVRADLEANFSDFGGNLLAILNAEGVSDPQFGTLVAIVPTYRRIIAATDVEPEAVDEEMGTWIGSVGETITVTGTISVSLTVDGFHPGTSSRLIILDTPQGVVKMMTAARWSRSVSRGDTITVAGIVKGHSVYRTTRQTLVNRPKLVAQTTTRTEQP